MNSAAPTLRVATFNIHKGFSHFNLRMMVHELRERLRDISPDIVFLQEVQGHHLKHAARHPTWPERPQHEFLAEGVWEATAYGKNVAYDHGHHGNAILSRFPILTSVNHDVTDLWIEKRGMLHCEMAVAGLAAPLHCVCVHLSLLAGSRARQLAGLVDRLGELAPEGSPLVIAGDFNDWTNQGERLLAERLGLTEIFTAIEGLPARSFPSWAPALRLDRVYVRGFNVQSATIHADPGWARLSDHAALSAVLSPASRSSAP